jgi:outer membrane protein assembly factor BamB
MKSGVGKKGSAVSKFIVLFLVLIILSTAPLTGSDSWSMFRHDAQHTGNSSSSAPNINTTLWTNVTTSLYSSPAVADDRLFLGGNAVRCFNASTGELIWENSTGGGHSSPATADGLVYIGSYDYIYCFDVDGLIDGDDGISDPIGDDGDLVWISALTSGSGESSPTVSVDKIYINSNGYTHCFDAYTGNLYWKNWTGAFGSSPAVEDGLVFSWGSTLSCLNTSTGGYVWNYSTEEGKNPRQYPSPTVIDERVYAASYDGMVYCLDKDPSDGVDEGVSDPAGSEYDIIWSSYITGTCSSPAVVYGRVYIGSSVEASGLNRLHCLDATTGVEVWFKDLDYYVHSSPAVADGKVFVGADKLYCFDAITGDDIWNYSTGSIYSSPAVANGRLYVSTNSGNIYCFGSPPTTIDYIVIQDDAHNELTKVYLNVSESMTVYAAGYNSTTSTFVEYVEVDWTESGGLGSFDPSTGSSTTYTAEMDAGITTVTGENVVLDLIDDFIVEIAPSTILKQGWNLISIPLIQSNTSLSSVLQSIEGKYDCVQWYNNADLNDPWEHYKVGKAFGNDLFELNETMGFWIYITPPGDTIFHYNGTQLTSNQTITLRPGWNMVGYPSLTSYNRTAGLNNLTIGTHVDAIWTYNGATQKWKELTASDYFEIGKGYYIHAKEECTWEVPL